MMKITDEILLEKLKTGDIDSLGELYKRYKTLLFNYFLRTTGDYYASNDLLMEAFERIHKYSHSFKSSGKARSWIYQIASNLTKDYFKKIKRFESVDKTVMEEETSSFDITSDSDHQNKQLLMALSKLRPVERRIVNSYYLLEMTYEDIASNENITVNNARIKVCRALMKLKNLLKDSGI